MKRREVTAEERALFQSAFAETRPLAKAKSAKAKTPTAAKPAPQKGVAESGLDGRTAERLRRGMLEPDARLDLHGYTESAAHRALLAFLRTAQSRGHKLVLVVTGKGGRPPAPDAPFDMELDRKSRGVLKSAVPRWFREPQFASLIAGTRQSHRRHGGGGAMYVYLRKNRA